MTLSDYLLGEVRQLVGADHPPPSRRLLIVVEASAAVDSLSRSERSNASPPVSANPERAFTLRKCWMWKWSMRSGD